MNKKIVNHLIDLTQECLERYWKNDYEYVLSYCSESVAWIGSNPEQFMQGIEEVRADFIRVDKELKNCHLNNQEYFISHNDGNTCSICGRYLVTTDETEDVFLQAKQRCTFIWKVGRDKEPEIQCMHVSNPLEELCLNYEEHFPNWLGKRALQYVHETISQAREQKRFAITDKEGVMHFVYENEIEYVQADNHDTILCLPDGEKKIHMQFADFVKKYGSTLLAVHRSYAVNPLYVISIVNNEITMQNGAVIPIPEKKIVEVRKRLKNLTEK